MGEVGIYEIFVTANWVKYLGTACSNSLGRLIKAVHFRFDDLAQTGGQFGKGFEEFFIFHMERSKWIG